MEEEQALAEIITSEKVSNAGQAFKSQGLMVKLKEIQSKNISNSYKRVREKFLIS